MGGAKASSETTLQGVKLFRQGFSNEGHDYLFQDLAKSGGEGNASIIRGVREINSFAFRNGYYK